MNWRKPLLLGVDRFVRRSSLYREADKIKQFYALSPREQTYTQQALLTELIIHAASHVPHYKKSLRASGVIDSTDAVNLARFSEVPFLTKDIIRNEYDLLRSSDLSQRKWYENSTGGSTGEPVRFIQEDTYHQLAIATHLYHQQALGLQPGMPHLLLWGSDRDILKGTLGRRAQIINFLNNRTFINCFEMSQAGMRAVVETIARRKPVLIQAYVDCVYEVARFINANKIEIEEIQAIITSAGNLYPYMRQEIQQAFNCPVYNRYGSREMGAIALEEQGGVGLHVNTYTHFVEIVDANGAPCSPGNEGEIIITSLHNYAMPFIRYKIGDRAVRSEEADRPYNTVFCLKELTGRMTEAFVKKDGTVISPVFFIHFLGVVHNSGWIEKVQIVQVDYDRIQVNLVPLLKPTPHTLGEITASIRHVMGSDCAVEFNIVDSIPASPSGKFQYVRSLVNQSAFDYRQIQDS